MFYYRSVFYGFPHTDVLIGKCYIFPRPPQMMIVEVEDRPKIRQKTLIPLKTRSSIVSYIQNFNQAFTLFWVSVTRLEVPL